MHQVIRRRNERSEFLKSDENFFFFLSFAFTNGNVFWSQGFYNWENLQLIQYISRFHNFTISDVKSKKKKTTTTHKQIDKIPQIVSKYLTAFITLSLKNYKISSIPRQSNERSLFRRSLKKPLNFALNCAKQPLHCRIHLLTTLYSAGILFLE